MRHHKWMICVQNLVLASTHHWKPFFLPRTFLPQINGYCCQYSPYATRKAKVISDPETVRAIQESILRIKTGYWKTKEAGGEKEKTPVRKTTMSENRCNNTTSRDTQFFTPLDWKILPRNNSKKLNRNEQQNVDPDDYFQPIQARAKDPDISTQTRSSVRNEEKLTSPFLLNQKNSITVSEANDSLIPKNGNQNSIKIEQSNEKKSSYPLRIPRCIREQLRIIWPISKGILSSRQWRLIDKMVTLHPTTTSETNGSGSTTSELKGFVGNRFT